MAPSDHPPEWPDKVVYSALLLIIGGTIGALFDVMRWTNVVFVGDAIPGFITNWPIWVGLPLAMATTVLGFIAFQRQASRWVLLGSITAMASMSAVGLTPILGLIALLFLWFAFQEGEEMVDDDRIVEAHQWPDKAMTASLFLVVGGLAAWMQGVWIIAGGYVAPFLPSVPAFWGTISLFAGAIMFWAGQSSYNQKRLALCIFACIIGFISLGLYVIAPVMSILAMVFLVLATGEGEFDTTDAANPELLVR